MITAIREVRRAKGLTLADVAARCEPPTTAQTIGRLETGTRTVSVGWLNRIAKALGVEAADLVQLPDQERVEVAARLGADGAARADQAAVGQATPAALRRRGAGDRRVGGRLARGRHGVAGAGRPGPVRLGAQPRRAGCPGRPGASPSAG